MCALLSARKNKVSTWKDLYACGRKVMVRIWQIYSCLHIQIFTCSCLSQPITKISLLLFFFSFFLSFFFFFFCEIRVNSEKRQVMCVCDWICFNLQPQNCTSNYILIQLKYWMKTPVSWYKKFYWDNWYSVDFVSL